jgi:hypothetical protein
MFKRNICDEMNPSFFAKKWQEKITAIYIK